MEDEEAAARISGSVLHLESSSLLFLAVSFVQVKDKFLLKLLEILLYEILTKEILYTSVVEFLCETRVLNWLLVFFELRDFS